MKIKNIEVKYPSTYISTWQSIFKQPKEYFDNFKTIVVDEAHEAKADSITTIMEKLENCPYRYGFTGTIDDTETNKLVLEGLFGKVKQVMSTKELMDREQIAKMTINNLILQYPESERKQIKKQPYSTEMEHIVTHEKRNKFITNLACSFDKNSLILYQRIKHGQELYRQIKEKVGDTRNVYLINSEDASSNAERERIRKQVEHEEDSIIIASYGVFSMGISIKNIHYLVFASPYKSKIKVLQSIGRGLRQSKYKSKVKLYDIVDDLSINNHMNHLLKHFMERIKIYNKEQFDYKTHPIPMGE